MKKLLMIAAMTACGGCLAEKEQSMIVVDGEGVVMATPDTFNLQAEIHANTDAKSDALKAVSQAIDQIGARLPALEDLDAVEINSASVAVAPVRDNQCVKDADYTQRDACPITRFRASARMEIKGAPATIAGNALSFLSELGAAEVQLTGYSFSNLDNHRTEATVAALTDARAKAERLAGGMGVSLGDALRVQYGEGVRDNFSREQDYGVYASATLPAEAPADRFAPAVELSLKPLPIEIREKVTAAYAIKRLGN